MATDRGQAGKGTPASKTRRVRVRATRLGYYDHKRRREGDVFLLADEREFSANWMEEVSATTPIRETAGTEALRRQHEALRRERAGLVQDESHLGMLTEDAGPTGAQDPLA